MPKPKPPAPGSFAIPDLGMGENGPVDLEAIDCRGCEFKIGKACKRNPPVWVAPYPIQQGKKAGMVAGTWSFPPAGHKCGDFVQRHEGVDDRMHGDG